MITSQDERNVLNFLNEVYRLTNGMYCTVSLTRIAKEKKCKYYANLGAILKNNGIVKQKLQRRSASYLWASIKPNLNMARKVLEEAALMLSPKGKAQRKVSPKKKEVVHVVSQEPKTVEKPKEERKQLFANTKSTEVIETTYFGIFKIRREKYLI